MTSVRYLVDDVAEAVRFYTDDLGFTVRELHEPAIAILSRADLTLWLAGPTSSAARPMPDGRRPAPGGWNRFVLEVEDLPALVDALRDNGVPFRNDIVTGPGGQQILVEDPSGNVIELFEPAARR
ncbi:VOC family protein [Nocardioides sp. TF02-7]|uniref:VOC family protein n=1 Tax=Nocardioides sp. TF02-7 TaxID=2917724 RepID=UPI001F06D9C5|nr:VOC family protein [Nocardioides sp. TF02-7]UMG93556.1 VOC family protein [Nocardioides sp. TF02-7]